MHASPERSGLSVAIATVACALALAACGSTGKPATSRSSNAYASFLSFSKCMRAHGVSNFPDPNPGGGVKIAVGPDSGLDPQAPAFQSARQSCKHLLPGGGPPATVPESVKLQMLRFAQCMRAHGVSDFPDPTFPRGGGALMEAPQSGVESSSPSFQSAQKACGGRG
jgi:hypothetical protein